MSKNTYYIDVNLTTVMSLTIEAKNKNEALKKASESIKTLPELELMNDLPNVAYADIAVTEAKIDDVDFSG